VARKVVCSIISICEHGPCALPELELELMLSQMEQKPVVWGEVGVRVERA